MKKDSVVSLDKPVSADVLAEMRNEWYLGADYHRDFAAEGDINGRLPHRKERAISGRPLKSSNKPGEMVIGIAKL